MTQYFKSDRQVMWITREQIVTNLASGAITNLGLYSIGIHGGTLFKKGSTITRMLVDLIVSPDAVAQRVRLYWGIVVVNADARAAGAFPDPEDVTDRPSWLVRGRAEVMADSISDASQWKRIELDLRSQRIMRSEEDELQLILSAATTGFVLNFSAFIRILVRMP